MATVTIKINSKTKRGKHLIALLSDMAKDGNDIQLERIPNAETMQAIEDVKNGNVTKAKNVADLMDKLNA